jgi:hypothetical protein
MAGLPSNNAWLAVTKQAAKGTPPATAQYKMPFTSGSAAPERVIDHLAETDNNVDQGIAYVSRFGAAGNPGVYARVPEAGLLLLGSHGTDTPSGAGPYLHVLTLASALPYLTFWRMQGGVIWERLNDCQISSQTIKCGAGEPLVIESNFIGRDGLRLAADPAAAVNFSTNAPLSFNDATVTVGSAGAVSTVSSFELTIDNALTQQQTDAAIVYDLARSGPRTISLSYDMIFENKDDYTAFHTGTTTGTTQSTTVYKSPSTIFNFAFDATNAIKFDLGANFAWEEFPLEPDSSGAPLVVAVRGTMQRPASGSGLTTTVTNSVATYPGI